MKKPHKKTPSKTAPQTAKPLCTPRRAYSAEMTKAAKNVKKIL
jgi:hypothetical protein